MNRILLIHRGSLGDFLLLLPALHSLRAWFPGARIEAFGRPEILRLAQPHLIDSVDSADRSLYLPLFENLTASSQLAALIKSFDAAFAFVNDPQGILEKNLLRLGVKKALVRPPFPSEDRRVHVAHYLREIVVSFLEHQVEHSRVSDVPILLADSFHFTDEEKEQAEQILNRMNLGSAPVAIHPGSGSERKCWPLDRYLELARRISQEGQKILFALGPADERIRRKPAFATEELGAWVVDSLPLRHLAAVLSRCAAYIGNDSGVTHLAALLGIPTVAIFGPTDPAVWGPVGPKVHVIKGSTECSPCSRSEMSECKRRLCLDAISVDMAESALNRY